MSYIIDGKISGKLRNGLTDIANADLVTRLEHHNTAFVIVQICSKQGDVIQGVVKPTVLAGRPCFIYTTDPK
jgi:hypothetical protein